MRGLAAVFRSFLARLARTDTGTEKLPGVDGRVAGPIWPEGREPICIPVAGLPYHNRYRIAIRLTLNERVRLRRETTNATDSNAIVFETRSKRRLGYVSRPIAAVLAPYMDAGRDPIIGEVAGIIGGADAEMVGIAVRVRLPSEMVSKIRPRWEDCEFCYDSSIQGCTYLFLNCAEKTLGTLNEMCRKNGLNWVRSGVPYRTAPNGKSYKWYVRLDGHVPENVLQKILEDVLGRLRGPDDTRRALEEWFAELSTENDRLRETIDELRKQICKLDVAASPPQRINLKQSLGEVLSALMPSVILVRESLKVIVDLDDMKPILRELRILEHQPTTLAKGVKGAPGWREMPFSTGRHRSGRLYLKRQEDRWLVLVSFKNDQTRDIDWLTRH
jgi:hypothetical protein